VFHKVGFTCGAHEIRHIRISCRCGYVAIHDLPIALEQSEMLVTCPKCASAFIICRTDLREGAPNSGFQIRRLGGKNEVKYAEPR
jgi:hypothetical protein